MEDEFFEQTKQQDEFHGYSEMPADTQAPSVPQVNLQPTIPTPVINNSGFNFANSLQQTQQVNYQTDQTLDRVRREEDELHRKLRLKAEQQATLKQKRKEKGAQQLSAFMEQRAKQVETAKATNKRNANSVKNKEYNNSWEKVVDNIATKSGDYPGSKDVSRMREAIVNKREDEAVLKR